MAETGAEVGIAFAFDRMQRTPNTRLAHRLIWEAGRQGAQDAIVDRLFRAYFVEGPRHRLRAVLESLAAEAGLDADGVKAALTGAESLEAVAKLEQQGYSMGIQGVPFFILLAKYGISGAQPPEFWRDALPKIAAGSILGAGYGPRIPAVRMPARIPAKARRSMSRLPANPSAQQGSGEAHLAARAAARYARAVRRRAGGDARSR